MARKLRYNSMQVTKPANTVCIIECKVCWSRWFRHVFLWKTVITTQVWDWWEEAVIWEIFLWQGAVIWEIFHQQVLQNSLFILPLFHHQWFTPYSLMFSFSLDLDAPELLTLCLEFCQTLGLQKDRYEKQQQRYAIKSKFWVVVRPLWIMPEMLNL